MTKIMNNVTAACVAMLLVMLLFPLQGLALTWSNTDEGNAEDAFLQPLTDNGAFSFNVTSSRSACSVGDTVHFDLSCSNPEALLDDETLAEGKDPLVQYRLQTVSRIASNGIKYLVEDPKNDYKQGFTSFDYKPTTAGTYQFTFEIRVLTPRGTTNGAGIDEYKIWPIKSGSTRTVDVVVTGKADETNPPAQTPAPTTPTPAPAPQVNKIAMYRVYNPNSGEHLFTKDSNEYSVLASLGWKQEGTAWLAPETGNEVYRLYNPNSGDHHYTIDKNEYNALGNIGWKQEGVAWHSGGDKAVYRVFNPNVKIGTHHYTTDQNEYSTLGKIGWKAEGIGWYGL